MQDTGQTVLNIRRQMDYLEYLRVYFARVLGVSGPAFTSFFTIASQPAFLKNVMLKMALDRRWYVTSDNPVDTQIHNGFSYINIRLEETGFVIIRWQNPMEFADRIFRMREGNFYFGGRLMHFQEWMKKYENCI